jgi:monofunctional biosynthetic peptidoglycan transglycosylase
MVTRLIRLLLFAGGCFLFLAVFNGQAIATSGDRVNLDFSSDAGGKSWAPLNDTIMGGQSSGRFEPIEGAMRFSGTLSQENRGGFASIRGEERPVDLAETEGFELRVRGDGRTYSLMLWTDDTPDRVYYTASLAPPAGEWATLILRWNDFKPYFRGFWVAQKDLDPSRITSIGMMISDGKAGPFTLDIQWLRSKEKTGSAEIGVAG